MSDTIDHDFENYVASFSPFMRPIAEENYQNDKRRVKNGGAFGRLKDVKEWWWLMCVKLPDPVPMTTHPWLFTIDWHFDTFDVGLQQFGTRIPNSTRLQVMDASKNARGLYNAKEYEAARDVMAEIGRISWTRKISV